MRWTDQVKGHRWEPDGDDKYKLRGIYTHPQTEVFIELLEPGEVNDGDPPERKYSRGKWGVFMYQAGTDMVIFPVEEGTHDQPARWSRHRAKGIAEIYAHNPDMIAGLGLRVTHRFCPECQRMTRIDPAERRHGRLVCKQCGKPYDGGA